MSRISSTGARNALPDAINRVAFGGERVVIERHGKPIAAIISIEELQFLEDHEDKIDVAAARKAMKEPTVPWEEVKAKLDKKKKKKK